MSASPNNFLDGTINFKIFSNGKELSADLQLISFRIRKEINRIGKALLIFDAGDMPEGKVPESEKKTFDLGNIIDIQIGYGSDLQSVFSGMVVSHNINIDSGNEGKLEIECRDLAYKLTQGRKNKIFNDKLDSDIISAILAGYDGISLSVEDTKIVHKEQVHQLATDWDFILSRAAANGLIVIPDGEKLELTEPKMDASSGISITYGNDLIEFGGKVNSDSQYEKVTATSWDPSKQATTNVTSKIPALNKQGSSDDKPKAGDLSFKTSASLTQPELQTIVDFQALKIGLSRIQGPCKFCGNAAIQVGKIITLAGLSKRFNGDAYIGALDHEFNESGWTTTVEMGLPYQSFVSEKGKAQTSSVSASIASAGMNSGLQIAKVVKLEGDPYSEYKIQIEIPVLNDKENTLWARLGAMWASPQYGSFFIPDVGDEVIVAFINNDPNQAVVIGSLYSSKQKPPYELEAKNDIHAIVTKSGMKIEFKEEDKVISIETPGGNKIQISDKDKGIQLTDQNSNKIIMNDSEVTIESAKALNLKAKTNIVIEAGANLNIKAKSNLTAEGVNVEAKAQAQFTAKGNAKAELSASGQTVVKGAMVMIN